MSLVGFLTDIFLVIHKMNQNTCFLTKLFGVCLFAPFPTSFISVCKNLKNRYVLPPSSPNFVSHIWRMLFYSSFQTFFSQFIKTKNVFPQPPFHNFGHYGLFSLPLFPLFFLNFFSRYDNRCSSSLFMTKRDRMLQCVAVCCSVLQCIAVYCSVLQCIAVCCSVLQCVPVYYIV